MKVQACPWPLLAQRPCWQLHLQRLSGLCRWQFSLALTWMLFWYRRKWILRSEAHGWFGERKKRRCAWSNARNCFSECLASSKLASLLDSLTVSTSLPYIREIPLISNFHLSGLQWQPASKAFLFPRHAASTESLIDNKWTSWHFATSVFLCNLHFAFDLILTAWKEPASAAEEARFPMFNSQVCEGSSVTPTGGKGGSST